jgi:iron-sulfur cluster repair protein YtfE (RIC family)
MKSGMGGLFSLHRRPQDAVIVVQEPVVWLEECHQRIRLFSNLACRLCEKAPEDRRPQWTQGAGRVLRYFQDAFPLHVQDEDISVFPKVERWMTSPKQRTVFRLLEEQHRKAEQMLINSLPLWKQMASGDELSNEQYSKLEAWCAELVKELEQHLVLEELELFPILRIRLSSTESEAILKEMKARRQAGWVVDTEDVVY